MRTGKEKSPWNCSFCAQISRRGALMPNQVSDFKEAKHLQYA